MVHLFHLFYLFYPFFFSLFLYLHFFSIFGLSVGFFFSSSVFLFSPVLAGGDFGALDGDFLPCVTWVHPSFSLLLGWSPVSVGCVSGMLIFGIVFVVVDDTDEAVAVVGVTVVLLVFCGQDLEKWPICLQCWHLQLPAFHYHHHGLILIVQCMGYFLETSSV